MAKKILLLMLFISILIVTIVSAEQTTCVSGSGPCCDSSLGLVKIKGEQPTNVTDKYVCSHNRIYFRDYYCDGFTTISNYNSTLIKSCGSCGYCENGFDVTECVDRPVNYQCNNEAKCSYGIGDNYYNTNGEYACQGYCDGKGYCDYADNCIYDSTCDRDDDNDGYNDDVDCNDNNKDIHPGVKDLCDQIDNDCDKDIDEDCFTITINNPAEKEYNVKCFDLDIEVEEELNQIEYIINNARPSLLCRNCDGYTGRKCFKEGSNNLTIKATNDGNIYSNEINFFIDTRKPRILKTEPRGKSCVNNEFKVYYDESNVRNITLYYGDDSYTRYDCQSGKTDCLFDVNLDQYEGQSINYNFELRDSVNSFVSRAYEVKVDNLIDFDLVSPVNGNYGRGVLFEIGSNEKIKCSYSDNGKRPVILFSRKDSYSGTKYFANGEHNIVINCADECGNSLIKEVKFNVSY